MEAFVIFVATESCKNSSYFMQHKKMFFGENKVIDPEYSEYWAYTVAHRIDCVRSKMINHGLNYGLFL